MYINKRQTTLFIAGIAGIMTFLYFILNLSEIRNGYHIISILPLVYGISSIMLSVCKNLSFLKIIIMLCYSVKLVIIPLLISLTGYQSFYSNANPQLIDYIPNAVFLQCSEIVSVTLFLLVFKDKSPGLLKIKQCSFSISLNPRANTLLLFLFAAAIGLLLLYPQFLYNYQPISLSEPDQLIAWTRLASTVRDTIPVYVYYLGGWIISIAKLLIPFYLVVCIYNGKQTKAWLKIILSLIIIFISCLFTSSARAATIFSAIIGIILLQKIYPKHSSSIMRILLVGGGLGIFVIFIYESIANSSNVFASLVYKLNAYFAGIFNVSAAFLMDNPNWLEYFFGDFFRSIPLIKGFFMSMPMSTLEFNRALAIDTEFNSQILPAIGQGYFYFGYLGAILIPLLMIKIAFYLFNKMQRTHDSFTFFALGITFIYILLGVYLYDMFLSFSLVLNNALPMLIIMKLSQYKLKR